MPQKQFNPDRIPYKSATNVGDWQGLEVLAAAKFNSLVTTLTRHYQGAELHAAVEAAWEEWGQTVKLLTMSGDDVEQYVTRTRPH